jgi:hypothetical protein
MNTNKRAGRKGRHIKYTKRGAFWIDGVVLFVGSAIALIAACSFVAAGVSENDISRTMVWLSCPWFLALYFVSWKLRKL